MTRFVLIAAILFGCSSKKEDAGPSCEKVVDHMLELTKQMVPGHDPGELGNKKQMVDQCVARKMPAKVRSCLVAAKNLDELASCRAGAKPAPAPAPPPGNAAPEPPPSRPLPTGSAAPGSGS